MDKTPQTAEGGVMADTPDFDAAYLIATGIGFCARNLRKAAMEKDPAEMRVRVASLEFYLGELKKVC